MKRYFGIILILAAFFSSFGQTNMKYGGGYFGHTLTHPGVVLEFEIENMYSEKASMPLRIDVGYYSHPRNHNGVFLDINYGFRRNFKSGLFLEESIGIGALATFLNAGGVFEVDETGKVTEVSKFNTVDFMPSLTLGIGYNLTKNTEKQTLIWVRPKIYWQYPHKTTSTFNPVIQIGFSRNFSN